MSVIFLYSKSSFTHMIVQPYPFTHSKLRDYPLYSHTTQSPPVEAVSSMVGNTMSLADREMKILKGTIHRQMKKKPITCKNRTTF